MTKLVSCFIAAAALSLAACDRPAMDKSAKTPQDFGPPQVAQAPDKDLPYRDPSIPQNPPENRASATSPVHEK